MKKKISYKNSENGNALAGSVIFLFVISIFGFAFLSFGSYEAQNVEKRFNELKIFWQGEEAISKGIAHASKESNLLSYTGIKTGPIFGYEYRYEQLEGDRRKVKAIVLQKKEDGTIDTVLKLAAIVNSKKVTDYFSIYHKAGRPYFDDGDTVNGKMYGFEPLQITGNPIFKDSFFTADKNDEYNSLPLRAFTIPTNIEKGVKAIRFDAMANLIKGSNVLNINVPNSKNAVVLLNGTSYTLRYRSKGNESILTPPMVFSYPKNGGLFFNGDVEVSGILKGKLTIGASEDIIITDDLLYSDSESATGKPRSSSTSSLALIAEGDIKVFKDNAKDAGGIKINGVMIAPNGSFEAPNYRTGDLGTMHLWGSVIQYERGIIGTVRLRGTQRLGYKKSFNHDARLNKIDIEPPFIPPLMKSDGSIEYKCEYWERS